MRDVFRVNHVPGYTNTEWIVARNQESQAADDERYPGCV
jgi:hypothetical protein